MSRTGADIGADLQRRHHYAVKSEATGELPFLLTSCCPSWSMLTKKVFPGPCRRSFSGIDTDGCDCKDDQTEASKCKGGIYRSVCVKETRGIKKKCAQ